MSKRLTIVLSDEEYAALEAAAENERRTPRQQAEYLITHPQPAITITQPYYPTRPYINPMPATPWWQPITITSPNTCDSGSLTICGDGTYTTSNVRTVMN